jgi:hypothetical protein
MPCGSETRPHVRRDAPGRKARRRRVEIRSMADLLAAFRACRDELQLTYETIDEIAGWPDRYANKILAPEPIRNLGWVSFGLALAVFGKKLLLVDDPEQIKRVEKRWTPRERPKVIEPADRAGRVAESAGTESCAQDRGHQAASQARQIWLTTP